jgi:hypothetical protein
VSGIAIVVLFLVLAGAMIARLIPALLAVPLMALGIAAVAGDSPSQLAAVVGGGAVALAPVYATVIFGALLSRVVLQTGIAETIVAYAAEFGGDRPFVLALVLCAAVALLFTSATGLGAIIMIGTIVLPVMLTVGVPRATAATLFLLAFALGYILNIAQWKFYRELFGVDQAALQNYVAVLFVLDALALLAFALVRSRVTRDEAAFALAGEQPRRQAGPLALLAPVLPLILYVGLHVEALVAFLIAAVYGAAVTRPRALVQTLTAAWIRGLEDVAPAVILMMGIGMLLASAKTPAVQAAVTPVIAALAPRSPLAYVVLFGLLSPLALYRGPLNPFGVGIGVYAVLATLHVLPPVALVAAVMAVVQVQNACDPTNTQNVWVANFTGVPVERITRLALPYQVAVATLGVAAVAVFGGALFGAPPFAPARAAAAVADPLAAPPQNANVVGVLAADDAAGPAADAVERALGRNWPNYRVLRLRAFAPNGDCAQQPVASVLRVSVEQLGAVRDVGLELLDCGGWSVNQWHEQSGDVPYAARSALLRVRGWTHEQPALAANVFGRGIAFDPEHPTPTYFYALYKTTDGYMRAYVRPGGPAWRAGMRSDDVIDQVDGRWWWEYGTFQTQARAYDGRPHRFAITRGDRHDIRVELGEPYRGEL